MKVYLPGCSILQNIIKCVLCPATLDLIFGQIFPTFLKDSVAFYRGFAGAFLNSFNLKSGPLSLQKRPKNLLFRNVEICLKLRPITAYKIRKCVCTYI